ncbi:hypothetical protein GP486_006202 [Trichoglossum hirsutum]|uniref:Uncharacterized protein n=1 Tax=Trichoglossum hirsutum TaxID=265104 RepID=A0A9P8IK98_9PEZI|nr:hypothetical protein GP486_006202 [Trichoglossum hirsutum]
MAEEIRAPPIRPFPSANSGLAPNSTSSLRQRPVGRAEKGNEAPPDPLRRRSSLLSDYSLDDARASLRSSTDDLISPKPNLPGRLTGSDETSSWHSAPLAFALLPAVGGMFFHNGGAVVTDIMLLGLAGVFLNWAVRLPWEWYHSSQSVRLQNPYSFDDIVEDSSEDEQVSALSDSTRSAATTDETSATPKHSPGPSRRSRARKRAAEELRQHEFLSLLSCFLFPLLGAYLLHAIRFQLSRPSEGLVNNFNLTVFLLASEVRPVAHLIRLVRSRTLYLQRTVNENPYRGSVAEAKVLELGKRVEMLECHFMAESNGAEGASASKNSAAVSADVRRGLQPDLDALNRAVRRYEKKATIQAMQTEARLMDLEARLSDVLSLAAAAQNGQNKVIVLTNIVAGWISAALLLPVQMAWGLLSLPAAAAGRLLGFGKGKLKGGGGGGGGKGKKDGRYTSYGRPVGERLQGRGVKKM